LDAFKWHTSMEEEYVSEISDTSRPLLKPDISTLSFIATSIELDSRFILFFYDEASLVLTSITTLVVRPEAELSLAVMEFSMT
jgi:hypothetical protein